jgi:serine/threonine-protein kinase
MADDDLDIAVARNLRQAGVVTPDQLTAAMEAQAQTARSGAPISLAEALVRIGALTAAQREAVEKKVQTQKSGIQELGHFKLLKKLGEGGMGAVYLAEDAKTSRKAALKVLPKQFAANAEFLKRFRREAEAASKLQHPNIVGAYASGQDLGYHFYVMEYCDGESLDRLLAREKTMPWDRAADVVLQAARALQYAHAHHFIHRDIKPANIFLTKEGVAKLLDLGLSKKIIEETGLSFQTVSGAILGTPHYISPEQAAGERTIDGRADIYSLGATFYHLLTGEPPFPGTTALEIIAKHVNAQLPNPQDVQENIPDGVVHVIRKMMAKKPQDRYPDCGALLEDLEEIAKGRAPKSEALAPERSSVAVGRAAGRRRPPTGRRAVARRPRLAPWAVGAGLIGVGLVALLVALLGGPSAPLPSPAPPKVTAPPSPAGAPVAPDITEWAVIGPFPCRDESDLDARHPPDDAIEFAKVYPGKGGPAAWRAVRPLGKAVDLIFEMGPAGYGAVAYAVSHLDSPMESDAVLALGSDDGCRVWWNGQQVFEYRRGRPLVRGEDQIPVRVRKGMNLLKMKVTQGNGGWGFSAALSGVGGSPIPGLRSQVPESIPRAAEDLERPWIEKVMALPADEQVRRVVERLKELNPGFDGEAKPEVDGDIVRSLEFSTKAVTRISPLRAFRAATYFLLAGSAAGGGPLSDLSPLRQIPIDRVSVHGTRVPDLSPLRGLGLTELYCSHTPISDLSPIQGMPLRLLACFNTRVRDIKPIEGMPLEELYIAGTQVTDLTPLRTLTRLRILNCDFIRSRDAAILQAIPTLEHINNRPAAEFWKQN